MTEKVEEYAAGLAKLADAEGELNRVADELYQLGRTVESSDQLRSTLSDRAIPASRRIGILEDLLGATASPVTINLVSMLVGAGRGSHIGPIADELIRQRLCRRLEQQLLQGSQGRQLRRCRYSFQLRLIAQI